MLVLAGCASRCTEAKAGMHRSWSWPRAVRRGASWGHWGRWLLRQAAYPDRSPQPKVRAARSRPNVRRAILWTGRYERPVFDPRW